MTASRLTVLALGLLGSCAETPPELQPAKVADVEYSIPVGWESHDVAIEPGAFRVEWRPQDNARNESVAIVVTPPLPSLAGHGIEAAAPLLAPMLKTLPSARFAPASTFTTRQGMRGLAVRGDFVPDGKRERHARSHAVLEHGDGLIHVIYTVRNEDSSREAYQAVLDSIHVATEGGAP